MSAERIPNKPNVSERELVQDMAETMSLHDYTVAEHTLKENHERDETTLTVKFVRQNSGQGKLALAPDDEPGEGEA